MWFSSFLLLFQVSQFKMVKTGLWGGSHIPCGRCLLITAHLMPLGSGTLAVCSQGQFLGFSPGDFFRDRNSAHSVVINLWTPRPLGILLSDDLKIDASDQSKPPEDHEELPGKGWCLGRHAKGLWGIQQEDGRGKKGIVWLWHHAAH